MRGFLTFALAGTAMLVACDRFAPVEQASVAKEPETQVKPGVSHAKSEAHERGHDTDDLTLQEVMSQLGEDTGALSDALWVEDFDGVSKSAKKIADHPHVGPSEVARIKGTLGADMAGFASYDKRVHGSAARLSEAAAGKDVDAVLKQLSEMQSGCVACHGEFRQRLLPPQE